jgi:UDP-glucuronate decarboxylase
MDLDDGRVVSNFIRQTISREDLTIYGDGSQTRSLCFVSDLVKGLFKMMQKDDFFGPVNLGNPEELTVKQIAELVKKETKSDSRIVFFDLPPDDPTKRKPDITLAKNILSWEPTVALQDGLNYMIEDFKRRIFN